MSILFRDTRRAFGCIWKAQIKRRGAVYPCASVPLLADYNNPNLADQRRSFFYKLISFLNPKDDKLKKIDRIEPHYQIIYKGLSNNYVKYSEGIGTVLVAFGVSYIGLRVFLEGFATISLLWKIGPVQWFTVISFVSVLYAVIFMFGKSYVYRIYYSEKDNKYVLVFKGPHPFTERRLVLAPGSLEPYPLSNKIHPLYLWRENMYITRDGSRVKLMINKDTFSVPFYFHNLLHSENSEDKS